MVSPSDFKYIFHHVFLPPRLPHKEDNRLEHDVVLTRLLRVELENFHDGLLSSQRSQAKRIIEMVKGIEFFEGDTAASTLRFVNNLKTMTTQDIYAIHIEKQNAGIIVRRSSADYSFETFELSPKNEDLMTTPGRLRRYFPGPAIAISSQDHFQQRALQEALLQYIEGLVRGTPVSVHSKSFKANTSDIEIRNTIDPALVTGMLTECLHAIGRRIHVQRIQKRTRDVVQWKGCLEPWRRSSRWLFLRVCLQIGFMEGEDNDLSHIQYKSFMIFFMCQILRRALQGPTPRESLFIMSMKIQRRLLKLHSSIDSVLQSQVQQVLSDVSSHLKRFIPTLSSLARPDLSVLRPEQDTRLSMHYLRPYIALLSTNNHSTSRIVSVEPKCDMRILQTSMEIPSGKCLSWSSGPNLEDARLALADTEMWVADHLPRWLKWYQASESQCLALQDLMSSYQEASGKAYKDIVEDQSVRLLTLLDLWVSLDKCVIYQEPLLKDYRCGLTSNLFGSLLLPTKPQMIRLASIEKYISDRDAASLPEMPCIFTKINTTNSFSVRYFNQSSRHQRLRDKIIADAHAERSQKTEELKTKLQAYETWRRADMLSVCEYRMISRGKGSNRRREMGHKARKCQKCIARATAEGIKVAVHEWPLSENESEAKSTVFELDVPKIILAWRDSTYGLLVDIFSTRPKERGNIAYYYFGKSTLKKYVQNEPGRLQLGSQVKPFIVTHYRQKQIASATLENILKPNGLSFMVVDFHWQVALSANSLTHLDVEKLCNLQFAPPFAKLQGFLRGTHHTTNDVIAKQIDCPATLTLHEYYEISSLRSGINLQWMNILRGIETRNLDFNREESFVLIAQAAWQAGPAALLQQCRDSHQDLEDRRFGVHLLTALNRAFLNVEANWQGAGSVRIFTMLTTRLLSVSSHVTIHEGCFDLLLRIQLATIAWTRDVISMLHNCQDEVELESLKIRALEVALTCNGTFDVETHHLKNMLRSVETQAVFIEILITVRDRRPKFAVGLSAVTRMCLRRFDRISHRTERILREIIILEAQSINNTIGSLWSGYKPGSDWRSFESPNERWLRTETAKTNGSESHHIEFNVLSGELLINGAPLARLPQEYEDHPTYRRLFGQKMLDVIPSTMPGMAFETRKAIYDQQFHFNMIGEELIVRTRKGDECFEVIPKHALRHDFTESLIQNYIFMRNHASGAIQLRPIEDPWTPLQGGWRIHSSPNQSFYLSNGSMMVVDSRSTSAIAVSQILRPFDNLGHTEIILNQIEKRLEIRLSRFNLDFYKKSGDSELVSKQFRGMFVDEDQNIGTFTGLVNKLVLRSRDKSRRIVIIPNGDISFTPHDGHVEVNISTESRNFCTYHDYRIDTQLGRLIDNGSLQARLFRLYLHALTSDVLPDELTGRTGTEEALEGLASASLLSFNTLSSSEIELLVKLRDLSPVFTYYPKNKRSMQTVIWTNLPTLSQHGAFSIKVDYIFAHARSLKPFQNELEKQQEIPEPDSRGDGRLISMANIRNAVYHVDGFGAENFTINQDKEYDSRDGLCDANRRAAIFDIAVLAYSWPQSLNVSKNLQGVLESFPNSIRGPDASISGLIGYDTKWLDEPADFLPKDWFAIYQELSLSSEHQDKYKIMIFLATLTFSKKVSQEIIHTLLAFATNHQFRHIRPPQFQSFCLSEGFEPDQNVLVKIITSKAFEYADTPASKLVKGQFETEHEVEIRREGVYAENQARAVESVLNYLTNQWPTEWLVGPTDQDCCTYVDVKEATAMAQKHFMAWFRNNEFKNHMRLIQVTLNNAWSMIHTTHQWTNYEKSTSVYTSKLPCLTLKGLLKSRPPLFFNSTQLSQFGSLVRKISSPSANENDARKVSQLLLELSRHTSDEFEAHYCGQLQESLDALSQLPSTELAPSSTTYNFTICLYQCQALVQKIYLRILEQLVSSISVFGAIKNTTMLPRLSKIAIFSLIAESHPIKLSRQWKRAIVSFGLAMTALQRAERLVACCGNQAELLLELSNPGHEGWDPLMYPDWLLLELENGILIRKDQADISREMISPSSSANSVMQLNMGLGKSSVIVPIAACALADKTKLCRIVVLRALSKQMMELLVKKLGGLINRRIYFVPISRALQMNFEKAKQLRAIYEACLNAGGILLVQPEHLLSLELMGLDMVLSADKDANVGRIINDTQAWLIQVSRDILDESDEILNVRFELVYTVGQQKPIDFAPHRWILIQRVLGILNHCIRNLDQQYQSDVEMESLPDNGSFARIRILHSTIGDVLLRKIVQHILDQGLPTLSFFRFTQIERDILFNFIIDPNFSEKELSSLREFGIEDTKQGLLLLRGLFAHGVLRFAFSQKRWRVNFGLDLKRSSLSVPYHGKDVPAARSEFSHPETTVILTCLSYYYNGLSKDQAMECFKELLKSDNSQAEYEKWTRACPDIGSKFKLLSGVNLINLRQWSENVYVHLNRSKEMIDFYLNHLVLPKEMKEFAKKLSSSGWDIARTKRHPITGFSGTNDSKYILPLSIRQRDLPEQLSTNAGVLACLLRPENTFDSTITGEEFDAEILLDLAITSEPPVRVILDVGAQVLKLRNKEVASRWLSLLPANDIQAAVFFDSSDELCVLNREGVTEPLTISPFAEQMDRCVVYMDEAHTRGTDLKLPVNYRAIVTLGPDLTKDRLSQACMRMRKLGQGQSVLLCAPWDIQRKILECTHMTECDQIEMKHVLFWCMNNTTTHIRKCVVPWAVQGKRHYERLAMLNANPDIIPESIQEPEAQTLEERYGLGKEYADQQWLNEPTSTTGFNSCTELAAIRAKCSQFGLTSFTGCSLHEEQERELQPEKEVEVQPENAPSLPPRPPILHPDVKYLIMTGIMKFTTPPEYAFLTAFSIFKLTSASKHTLNWPQGLWATRDYMSTVTVPKGDVCDFFLKPAHWIISFKQNGRICCVVISPFEANILRPLIEEYKKVTLSIYSPRLSLSLRSLETLSVHSIPPLPSSWEIPPIVMQLNLFAGQLYLRSYDEYIRLCQFLGLCYRAPQGDVKIDCDNFVTVSSRVAFDPVMKENCPFEKSPVAFLKQVFALRRKGQDFGDTHMGRILNGELLTRKDFAGIDEI